ncbi:MAG TPA: hypothetical protein VLC71_00910 [Thermomonas sp.]|nr:hypothetical protein [Thermomonas sp.]
MRATPRRHLSYATFFTLLALDAVALVSFLLVQVLGVPLPIAWLAAGLLTVLATPGLLRLSDKVFAAARSERTIPNTGESFL